MMPASLDTTKFIHASQVGGIDAYTIDEGEGRGVRALVVNTGGGLRYRVLVDRGLDIDQAFFNQHSLAFLSHKGVTRPTRALDAGADWLRGWPAGLLTSCGPFNIASPCVDEGESLGLHGTHSNTAGAIESVIQPDPHAGRLEMTIIGRVRYGKMFGPSVELKRTITSRLGTNKIHFVDEFYNAGNTDVPHAWLLHINLGYPLVDEGARIVYPAGTLKARDDARSLAYFKGDKGLDVPAPLDDHCGAGEVVAYLFPKPLTEAGQTTVALVNSRLGVALAVNYNTREFGRCGTWQHWGKHEYVTGIEPMNGTVAGRDKDRAAGLLDSLPAGSTKRYAYEIEIITKEQESWGSRIRTYNSSLISPGDSIASTAQSTVDALDPDLLEVVDGWPILPAALRRAVLALVRSSSSSPGNTHE